MHNRATKPNDYEEGPRFGPGIVVRSENFGPAPMDAEPDDLFARRQDAIQHLNTAVAEADAISAQALQDQRARFFDEGGATDFAARQRELLKGLRKEALKNAPDSSARDGLGAAFDRLSDRHLRRAVTAEHEARVRARAQGAERALERFKAAALADPDGFADRIAEADALLSRLVEAGTDPLAAAERAHSFRLAMGQAVVDDLAERDPAGALARLDSGAFNDAFDEEGRAGARNALLRVIAADREATEQKAALVETDAERERAARRRATVAALRAGLRDGTMDLGHITRAQYRGDIDGPDADSLRLEWAAANAERLRRAAAVDAFDDAVHAPGNAILPGGYTPADIDIWTKRMIERGGLLPEIIAKVIRIAGGVPEPYVDDVRRRILSAAQGDAVAAGREFRDMRRASSHAAEAVLARLPGREARQLALYADYAHLDLPAERIQELVDEVRQGDAVLALAPLPNTPPERPGRYRNGHPSPNMPGSRPPRYQRDEHGNRILIDPGNNPQVPEPDIDPDYFEFNSKNMPPTYYDDELEQPESGY